MTTMRVYWWVPNCMVDTDASWKTTGKLCEPHRIMIFPDPACALCRMPFKKEYRDIPIVEPKEA